MTKIAFIGAGSLGFTEYLARDILTASLLSLAEIRSMVNELFAQPRDYLLMFTHFTG
jgi:alpha-galactosidase/6-phospho-beta-glucosidase family protein